ncbi:FAD:protein FMN transferase [Desulfonatronovibrio magnus]|uniref:FAD:protein FMN transferase n=1 Tax=Desulfonatronovibrio magnus TaxID=698827 RepID=UPI000AE13B5B|nr:FAD:protein FMN transferase [Desulfonatronovibrio magnus]
MGTYYRVTLAQVTPRQTQRAEKKIARTLEQVNQSMSVFEPDSEVSRFNKLQPGQKLCVSQDFQKVMTTSFQVYEMTDRAFDPTLAPLIDMWGFGAENALLRPDPDQIEQALEWVGLDKVMMDEHGCLHKTHPRTELNLSGVAKGYAVDLIAASLDDIGIRSYLVDIGGDMFARGTKHDASPWRIGISLPLPDAGTEDLLDIIDIQNEAVATSGDYRNFFVHDNKRYSHIIDPATGYPVRQNIVSATVIAKSCVLGDALATAMLIMDVQEALKLADSSGMFEVLLIKMEDEELTIYNSSDFFHDR